MSLEISYMKSNSGPRSEETVILCNLLTHPYSRHSRATKMSDTQHMYAAVAGAFRSERLIYRAFQDNEEDRSFAYNQLASDALTKGLADPSVHRPTSRQLQDGYIDSMLKTTVMYNIICLPEKDPGTGKEKLTPIGIMNVKDLPQYQRRATFGIAIIPAYQSKGYGSEAVGWIMDWVFKWGGYHSLTLGASMYNERAVRAYKKAGFKVEGIGREVIYRDRKWWDSIQMSMLEQEWEVIRGIKTVKDATT